MKDIQATELNRYRNNITAHKIIKVDGSNVTVLLPWGDKTTFPIMSDNFSVGDWIDMQLKPQRNNGRVTSYSAGYIGRTPAKFIPEDDKVQFVTV